MIFSHLPEMSQLAKQFALVLLGFLFTTTAFGQSNTDVRELLDELDLSTSQRQEINAVLIGGMQALHAVNEELRKLDGKIDDGQKNPDIERMRHALVEQRFRLAQAIASGILGALDTEQLSKFDFGHLLETLPENANDKIWEQGL